MQNAKHKTDLHKEVHMRLAMPGETEELGGVNRGFSES
jgi:hypothetical protein